MRHFWVLWFKMLIFQSRDLTPTQSQKLGWLLCHKTTRLNFLFACQAADIKYGYWLFFSFKFLIGCWWCWDVKMREFLSIKATAWFSTQLVDFEALHPTFHTQTAPSKTGFKCLCHTFSFRHPADLKPHCSLSVCLSPDHFIHCC